MTIVVKIGGAAIEDAATLRSCAVAVADLVRQGQRVVVVHGGGKALSRTLQRLGIKSEFVDGLRVTSAETRDVAVMVLSGLVNKKLVAAVQHAGVPALGLGGSDGQMFYARKKQLPRELGFVGEIDTVNVQWLETIWKQGGVPILASVVLGDDGEYYNVNADEMAAACAVGCKADLLAFLTDVAGVADASGNVISALTPRRISELAADSVISRGMLPKLRACTHAVRNGVKRVQILPASRSEALCVSRLTSLPKATDAIGTEITCDDNEASYSRQGVLIEYTTAK
ncbi:MAG TPA: acetylglutamate kinase [Candidatus Sulfotelmatobacter sp.]